MLHRLASLAAVTLVLTLSTVLYAGDWPQWRGPNRDAISTETGLLKAWPADGPPLAWKISGVGEGYSSVSIFNGKIYTLGDLEDGSYLMALNEADGSELWKTKIGLAGGHKGYPGTRSTPTFDSGQLFALNQYADFVCVDANSGELVWKVNLNDDFNGKMMSGWKYSESALVDGNQVVITPGGKDGTVVALDRTTGKQLWRTKDWTDAAGYSSVIIATIEGTRQYIQLTGQSLAGIDPKTGKVLWVAERQGKTAVIPTPVVHDNVVFVTSGYGVGCNAFRVTKEGDSWKTEELYANKGIANHHGGVVLLDGHVFGSTNGAFRCLDLSSGELAFEGRSVGKGATIYADGYLYLRAEKGPVALIKATSKGLEEVSRFDQPDRSKRNAWAHPVVANGKLYLRDQDILLCYDISAK
ncbi:MAG: PQQ-like beta-propeller repeat protein [Planctomycetaceae bacterium]|jgi:outer membrane protein assembly factor BamB|nr:PQQ-like beta-propeller repeat protein [Planctomycetaceae bacterium]